MSLPKIWLAAIAGAAGALVLLGAGIASGAPHTNPNAFSGYRVTEEFSGIRTSAAAVDRSLQTGTQGERQIMRQAHRAMLRYAAGSGDSTGSLQRSMMGGY